MKPIWRIDSAEVIGLQSRDLDRRLRAADLADEAAVERLVRLVEVEPQNLLPQLRRLLESINVEELRRLHAPSREEVLDPERRSQAANARRELVWLAEKFLHFPEHFADAERILLHLALAETEAYANNASGVWKTIFRPLLSGTPFPFAQRLQLLEQRLQTTDAAQRALCLDALHGPLTADLPVMGRALGLPVVAGRLPPADWQPANGEEVRQWWTLTVDLLKRLARSGEQALLASIRDIALQYLATLLRHGFLPDVIEIIDSTPLPDALLPTLLYRLDQFLELDCAPGARAVPAELEAGVVAWRQRLVPDSLHGRLVSVVGQEVWHLGGQGEGIADEQLADLASRLLKDPGTLQGELPWLCSREARSAHWLGLQVGRLDPGATHLERVLQAALPGPYPGLAYGYVQGLLREHPAHTARVNELLDQFQQAYPRAVFDVISSGLEAVRPLERLLAMIDSRQLPVEFLRSVTRIVGHRPLNAVELQQVLERLTSAARQGNESAARAAVYVLWAESHNGKLSPPGLSADRELLERVLRETLRATGPEAHFWLQLLKDLGSRNPEAAIRLAVQALAGDFYLVETVLPYLAASATHHPELTLRLLGEALLDPSTSYHLYFRPLREVVQKLPVPVVLGWLERAGEPAAVALARHLPPPMVDPTGNPVVPELTASFLERFGDDARVFDEFCAGVHSGELGWGDVVARIETEGELARRFLDHPLPRIRDWAHLEVERAAHQASWWRSHEEELASP